MSKTLSAELPAELIHRLRHAGNRPVIVATVNEFGEPNSAPFSWLVAPDSRTIRLAITHNTDTLKNVRRNGRVCITVLGSGIAMTVAGRGRVIRETMSSVPFPTALVEVEVEYVKDDGELRTGPGDEKDVSWSKRRTSLSDARVEAELMD